METERRSELERQEAFGAEFGPLMERITRRYESLVGAGDGSKNRAHLWREAARPFERQAEELIAKHRVRDPFAAYVRHVLQEGFDVDFDRMDPTPRR